MTISAQEQQVRLQFLEEAQDYVDQIETGLLGVGNGEVKGKQLDAVMRAAHSIKGGAAMMSFMKLSAIGHRLEDSLKVMRYGQKTEEIDARLEKDLLAVVDRVRKVIDYHRKGAEIPADWLATEVDPLLERLYERLGEPQAADDGFFNDDDGEEEDIVAYLFETEVDSALQHLEDILATADYSTLQSELEITTETLNGLAEMIELPAMASLCQDISQKLQAAPDQFIKIAQLAIAAWRRSQSLVEIGQRDNLPTAITFGAASPVANAVVAPSAIVEDAIVESVASPIVTPAALTAPASHAEMALVDTLVPVAGADELELLTLNVAEEPASDNLLDFADLDFANFEDASGDSSELNFLSSLTGEDNVGIGLGSAEDSDNFGIFADITTTPALDFSHNESISGSIEELFSIDELSNFSEAMNLSTESVAELADSGSLPLDAVPEISELVETLPDIDTPNLDLISIDLGGDAMLDWSAMQANQDTNDFFGNLAAAEADNDANNFFSDLAAAEADNDANNFFSDLAAAEADNDASDFFSDLAAAEADNVDASDFFGALAAAEELAPMISVESLPAVEPEQYERPEPETFDNTPVLPEQTIRVGVERLAEIGDLFGELNISRSGLNIQVSSIRNLLGDLLTKVGSLEAASVQLRTVYDRISVQVAEKAVESNDANADFDRLEMDRYGDFHLLSQSVIESVVQIQEKVSDIEIQLNDTETVTRDINRTSKQMQTRFTTVRMLPLSEITGRYPRALREMAIEHGKEVTLKMKGSNLLIERHTIEVLKDPLMHLLRNCFDHGIEPAAERIAAGKSAVGLIEINACYRGNQIVIVIKDDGKGIDLDKIRAKALKMGIDEETLAAGGRQELLELIFEPGFSTAAKVTDLSGRGVGMDVVRTNLQEAKGNIHIETVAGQGSTFTITVPFTMSLMKVMITEANKMLFAFPVNGVEEMLLPEPDKISERDGQRYLAWQDTQVQLIQMKDCFQATSGLKPSTMSGTAKIDQPAILVVADGDRLFGLEIDRFWQEQEVTVRQPQGVLQMPDGISGCGVLGDGRVIPLVDPLALVRWRENAGSDANLALEEPLELPAVLNDQDLILVVDDSINVRRFVAMTLERNGYRVEEAKDGLDALEKVQAGLIPQAVICDLEMPRMDGYGFLANVKSIEAAQHVPVLMLTSRSSQKHRKIAMNLGAAAYFGKPFSETEILATLKELIVDSSADLN
jgi:two-component system, chemotaxis family, sensor histidine kinase and response regulator PixL